MVSLLVKNNVKIQIKFRMMDVMNVCILVLKIVNIVNMEYVRNVKDNFIYLITDAMK